jgi:hypothetical protein
LATLRKTGGIEINTIQKPSKEHFNVPVFKWAAMGRDGEWHCYEKKPSPDRAEWVDGGKMRYLYAPSVKFTGDWKDSLVEL